MLEARANGASGEVSPSALNKGNNMNLRIALCAAILLLQACSDTVSDQPQPTPKDVDHVMLNPKLIHGTYQFSGTVTSDMGTFHSVHTFSGKADSESLDIEWAQDVTAFTTKGSLSVNAKGGVLHMAGITQNYTDPAMAVAGATGVSGGCAHLIHSLWVGNRDYFLRSKDGSVDDRGNGRIVISGTSSSDSRKFEIVIDNGIPSSSSEIYDPKIDANHNREVQMTDDDIRDMLKKTSQPVTDEEIAKVRENMKRANASLKNNKEIIKTTTIITFTGLGN
jgi:hypothetical protein